MIVCYIVLCHIIPDHSIVCHVTRFHITVCCIIVYHAVSYYIRACPTSQRECPCVHIHIRIHIIHIYIYMYMYVCIYMYILFVRRVNVACPCAQSAREFTKRGLVKGGLAIYVLLSYHYC